MSLEEIVRVLRFVIVPAHRLVELGIVHQCQILVLGVVSHLVVHSHGVHADTQVGIGGHVLDLFAAVVHHSTVVQFGLVFVRGHETHGIASCVNCASMSDAR